MVYKVQWRVRRQTLSDQEWQRRSKRGNDLRFVYSTQSTVRSNSCGPLLVRINSMHKSQSQLHARQQTISPTSSIWERFWDPKDHLFLQIPQYQTFHSPVSEFHSQADLPLALVPMLSTFWKCGPAVPTPTHCFLSFEDSVKISHGWGLSGRTNSGERGNG